MFSFLGSFLSLKNMGVNFRGLNGSKLFTQSCLKTNRSGFSIIFFLYSGLSSKFSHSLYLRLWRIHKLSRTSFEIFWTLIRNFIVKLFFVTALHFWSVMRKMWTFRIFAWKKLYFMAMTGSHLSMTNKITFDIKNVQYIWLPSPTYSLKGCSLKCKFLSKTV